MYSRLDFILFIHIKKWINQAPKLETWFKRDMNPLSYDLVLFFIRLFLHQWPTAKSKEDINMVLNEANLCQ